MNTERDIIVDIAERQKSFYRSGRTRDLNFRKQALRRLEEGLRKWEKPLCEALWTDLHKSFEEAYLTEISLVKAEIRCAIRHTAKWARREHKPSPLTIFGSSSYVVKEPKILFSCLISFSICTDIISFLLCQPEQLLCDRL